MRSWPISIRRGYRQLALDVVALDGEQDEAPSLAVMAARATALLARTGEPRRAQTGRKREKEAARLGARERRHRIYAEVDARSGGRCETHDPGRAVGTEHDHFFGRGKAEESVETIWHLCRACHRCKTDNYPSRLYWLRLFRAHCQRHGYTAQVARCDRAIALEEAQHADGRSGRG